MAIVAYYFRIRRNRSYLPGAAHCWNRGIGLHLVFSPASLPDWQRRERQQARERSLSYISFSFLPSLIIINISDDDVHHISNLIDFHKGERKTEKVGSVCCTYPSQSDRLT